MPRHLIALLAVAALLLGFQSVGAQQPPPPLSTIAEALTRYSLTQADLPPGTRFTDPATERSNEDVIAGNPDSAEGVRTFGRITGLRQAITRASPPGTIVATIILLKDAESAWASTQTFTGFTPANELDVTQSGSAVGEHSLTFRYVTGSGANRAEVVGIGFQRDRPRRS